MKFIRIFLVIFVFTNFSNIAHPFSGSGPLKFGGDTFDWFLAYMRGDGDSKGEVGKKKGTPGMFAVNQEGQWSYYMYCPIKYNGNCRFEIGKVIQRCTKQSKERGQGRCYLFANQRKIVWDGKNIRLPRKFDEAYIESVFKENGWYGEDSKTTSSIDTTTGENKYIKKKKDKKKEDVVKKSKNVSIIDELKELKQLFDDGVITEREFKDAKKKYLKAVVMYDGPIMAPVVKNDKVAKLKIFYKDEIIGDYDLLASENIKRQNIFSRLITSINFLLWGDA